jgi:hypothetical protein
MAGMAWHGAWLVETAGSVMAWFGRSLRPWHAVLLTLMSEQFPLTAAEH